MKNFRTYKNIIAKCFAVLAIPLGSPDGWHQYQFSNIKANQISHADGKLKISVKASASPLIYAFKKSYEVNQLNLSAELVGQLAEQKKDSLQGSKNNDDFVLRLGLIVLGSDRLSWVQRQFAPQWLIDMEKLLPDNQGIDKVIFYTTCRQKELLNKRRSHFLNSLLLEECITLRDKNGQIHMQKKISPGLRAIGLWVASDGDDLKSEFDLIIDKIELSYSKKAF